MSEVVLKGELHSSSGDLDEERELVKQGVDTVILEASSSDAEFSWAEGWFSTSLDIFGLVMGNLYTDHSLLADLAEMQDAEVVYTRESDSELLDNTSRWMRVFGAGVFYSLVPISLLVGLVTGETVIGASLLFIGVMVPILGIRVYNMRHSDEDKNRDRIMAEKIIEASGNGGRTLAIVGDDHVEGILHHLPEEMDPEVKRKVYSELSLPHLREMIVPGFTAFSVLFVFYLLILQVSKIFVPLIL